MYEHFDSSEMMCNDPKYSFDDSNLLYNCSSFIWGDNCTLSCPISASLSLVGPKTITCEGTYWYYQDSVQPYCEGIPVLSLFLICGWLFRPKYIVKTISNNELSYKTENCYTKEHKQSRHIFLFPQICRNVILKNMTNSVMNN